ncbi:sulfite exporter TauE/SafE family protein [Candidatus Bathyarchaeota archaeon]|nr:sulfite exporter TauE/SafE family protein [Candidatus Bathyarchaeota archaeon]
MLKVMLFGDISNAYMAALLLGVSYGFTFCTSTCLPYITSYIASVGAGFRRGALITAIYNLGRIGAYAFIGLLALIFRVLITENALIVYQQYASIGFGAATAIIGANLFFKQGKTQCSCETSALRGLFDAGAFALGFSKGLIVCPPLMALISYSLASTAPIDSLILALLFGVGTVLSPLLLTAGVAGWLFNKAPLLSHWIARAGALLLVVLGLSAIVGGLFPS